ncbi:MAG: hypothetical protein IKY52_05810 [Clostridia bacterium]|nr:hypothetical protein [Clostridia bacterium]
MNSLRNKLRSFLWGRYGIDQLYYGLLGLYVVLLLLKMLLDLQVFSVLGSVVLLLALLRALSKNHAARRKENEVFLKLWAPIKTEMILIRDRFRDRKDARYRHCRHCRAILRLPVKKGSHTVVCPKCHKRFSVHIVI